MESVKDFIRLLKKSFMILYLGKRSIPHCNTLDRRDVWLKYYNEDRPHSGKYCYGKTPRQTFLDSKHIAIEKTIRACTLMAYLTVKT